MPDPQAPAVDPQVQRLMDAGVSDDDIVFFLKQRKASAPPAPPTKPTTAMEQLTAKGLNPMGTGHALQDALAHPVQTGAMLGGLAAAPLTGGLSVPAAMGLSGLAAAGGAGYGMLAKGVRTGDFGTPSANAKTLAQQGAYGAAGEGVGRLGTEAAMLTGRGLYRAGLLPTNAVSMKYPDLVKAGVENKVPITEGGYTKAIGIKKAAQATKATNLAAADPVVSYTAPQVAHEPVQAMMADAAKMRKAGLGERAGKYADQVSEFIANNPQPLNATELDAIKGTLDDSAGLAFRKLKQQMPLSAKERYTVEMIGGAKKLLANDVANYKASNKDIMDATGLATALKRRVYGSGANQGMENALTETALALGHPAAIPIRVASMPPVLGGLGIGAYQIGKQVGPSATTALKALLAMLGPESTPQP
jgi:hypothetical protein